MNQVSWFRGMAGEFVVDFVRPKSLAGAIPAAAAFLILETIAGHVGITGRWAAALTAFLLYVILAARPALALGQGREEPLVSGEELVRFTGHYLLLSLVWGTPMLILGRIYLGKAVQPIPELIAGPTVLYRTGFMGLGGVFLGLVLCFLPFLCMILVTRFSSLRSLFSRSGWHWVLQERTADLIAFYGAFWGGFALILGVYILPLKCLALISVKLFPGKAFAIASFLYFLPLAASARLAGRLSGAFVAGEHVVEVVADGGPLFSLRMVQAPPPPVVTTTALTENRSLYEPKPDLKRLIARVDGLEGEALSLARKSAEEAAAIGDTPLQSAIELALLTKKAGETEQSAGYAADAINRSAQRGFDDLCATMFQMFHPQRSSLKLTPPALEFLGYVLTSRGKFVDAAWCYHAAAVADGDLLKAQKKVIQAAQAAEKAGAARDAYFLYGFFINNYPDSTLFDYARDAHARLKPQTDGAKS